jgi:protein TonB
MPARTETDGKPAVSGARFLSLIFSLCLHSAIGGACFLLSTGRAPETERAYQVALVEFAPPGSGRERPSPETSAPAVETLSLPPLAAQVPPQPSAEKPSGEAKAASAKTTKPAARPSPRAAPDAARPATQGDPPPGPAAASAPGPLQFVGLSAYDQGHVDQRPSISRRVKPEYPVRARRLAVEGAVVVELIVDAAGLPRACVIHSADPGGYFEEAALSAAREMRFIPGKIRSVPVNTLVRLPFVFRLR